MENREDYFSIDALNASGAKLLLRSPAHYWADKQAKREPTPAMQFGTAVHSLILEPHKPAFFTKPAHIDRRTAAGKEAYASLVNAAGGLPIFEEADADRALRVRDAVHAHTAARNLIEAMQHFELPIQWRDYAADVPCKALLDGYAPGIILDVKTTQDASPVGFMRAVLKYRYEMQAAHYLAGIRSRRAAGVDFFFIAVETAAPYAVGVYKLDPEALSMGADLMERAADIYARCRFSGEWPGYGQGVTTLSLPAWAVAMKNEGEDFA